ncbi:MAG TPA: hypothetical protein PLC76_08780 [Saprospiraceae bacterium]|jgi:hypothetical protein|nr:MAG: hypothetical protein UZ08_BCD001002297 [Candidatus Parvibacillus calidus]MBX2937525.1 hypothetical protein [Saprospiraceae bacterium]MBK7741933.1 hypothetical protein [Candidatus Parvibacillus calidus]MBX7177984.1 hypothetical protein [Saprospiraceae bacterium]MCB0592358.1 hypothetical protein [Saprospiraceae bacterium]
MWEKLKNLSEILFRPLVIGYGLYFLYILYNCFKGNKYVEDKSILIQYLILKLLPALLILGVAFILKAKGNTKLAGLVLGVPALYVIVASLFFPVLWYVLSVVRIIFGK